LTHLQYSYNGKYADFLQAKDDRLALEDAAVQSAKAKYRLELDWMRRQPQARQTKAKARIDAFYKLEKSTKPRVREGTLIVSDGRERRIGGKILSLKHVNLRFGDKIILNDFSYDFCKGDRICLTGMNGVGKVCDLFTLVLQVLMRLTLFVLNAIVPRPVIARSSADWTTAAG
jgi:ABC transport system ATP-binding/permease protein